MATIDSLDLASLQNNPSSIAEALEDALETTSGTLGTLKSEAETKKGQIDTLHTQATTAKEEIDDLLEDVNAVEVFKTSTGYEGSVFSYDITSGTSDEDGIRILRFGKIYVFHLSIGIPYSGSDLFDVYQADSDDITFPGAEIKAGASLFKDSSHEDYSAQCYFTTGGMLKIYGHSTSGSSNLVVVGNFIGVDEGS